jgi:hypothetical protein
MRVRDHFLLLGLEEEDEILYLTDLKNQTPGGMPIFPRP